MDLSLPWKMAELESMPVIVDAAGKIIVFDCPEEVLKRIVSCVNFCDGTDSEFLDGAGNLGRMLAMTR